MGKKFVRVLLHFDKMGEGIVDQHTKAQVSNFAQFD